MSDTLSAAAIATSQDEKIRQRAYEIWESEGRTGNPEDHWFRAQQELDEQGQERGGPQHRSGSACFIRKRLTLWDDARVIPEAAPGRPLRSSWSDPSQREPAPRSGVRSPSGDLWTLSDQIAEVMLLRSVPLRALTQQRGSVLP